MTSKSGLIKIRIHLVPRSALVLLPAIWMCFIELRSGFFNLNIFLMLASIIWGCMAFTPSSFSVLPLRSSWNPKHEIGKSKCFTASSSSSKYSMDEKVPEKPSADWNLCTPIRQGGDAATNIGKAALKVGDAALKIGDAAVDTGAMLGKAAVDTGAKLGEAALITSKAANYTSAKIGEATSGLSTYIQSAISAAVGSFVISTLQPISKYWVFTAVAVAALLPFLPAILRLLEVILRATASAIIKVCYRFPRDIREIVDFCCFIAPTGGPVAGEQNREPRKEGLNTKVA